MEDWSYGGSWERGRVACKPSLGDYPPERAVYPDAALRCPMFLVETAVEKHPPESDLGSGSDILTPGGLGAS